MKVDVHCSIIISEMFCNVSRFLEHPIPPVKCQIHHVGVYSLQAPVSTPACDLVPVFVVHGICYETQAMDLQSLNVL